MEPETEEKNKQPYLFVKNSDGTYICMGPFTGVPTTTVSDEDSNAKEC